MDRRLFLRNLLGLAGAAAGASLLIGSAEAKAVAGLRPAEIPVTPGQAAEAGLADAEEKAIQEAQYYYRRRGYYRPRYFVRRRSYYRPRYYRRRYY